MVGFSVFGYLYRDASNYKAWGSLLLVGEAREADTAKLVAVLSDQEFFIAEQVGVRPLYDELWRYSDGPNDDDHVWHTFDGFHAPLEQALLLPVWGTVSELVGRFSAIEKWDETLSPHWILG